MYAETSKILIDSLVILKHNNGILFISLRIKFPKMSVTGENPKKKYTTVIN